MSETLILFFGRIGDRLGRERRLAIDGPCTVGELRQRLAEADPAAALLMQPGVRASVDREIAGDDTPLSPGQEVAFFLVFSGG